MLWGIKLDDQWTSLGENIPFSDLCTFGDKVSRTLTVSHIPSGSSYVSAEVVHCYPRCPIPPGDLRVTRSIHDNQLNNLETKNMNSQSGAVTIESGKKSRTVRKTRTCQERSEECCRPQKPPAKKASGLLCIPSL